MLKATIQIPSCLALLGGALLLYGCADASEKNNEELARSRDQQSQAMSGDKKAEMGAKYDAAKAGAANSGQ